MRTIPTTSKRRLRTAAGFDAAIGVDEPLEAVVWPVVGQAIGPAHRTVVEGIARLLLRSALDAVSLETPARTGESSEQLNTRS